MNFFFVINTSKDINKKMTHRINGNIVIRGIGRRYDTVAINNIVTETVRRNGINCSQYFPEYKLTKYHREDGHQPFIHVLDKPTRLYYYKPRENMEERQRVSDLIVIVESGSHVNFDDREAKEIYDWTVCLKRSLRKEIPTGLEVLFDNEYQLFLPKDFRAAIKQAA